MKNNNDIVDELVAIKWVLVALFLMKCLHIIVEGIYG